MTTHEPTQELPEQPTLPFEQGAPASSDEPTGPEVNPSEVWKALSAATKTKVRQTCLRAMREVVANAPE